MHHSKSRLPIVIIGILCLLLGLVLAATAFILSQNPAEEPTAPSISQPTESVPDTQGTTPPETTVPTPPPVVKESTATVGATGDILLHDKVIYSGYRDDGSYDFHYIFRYLTDYIQNLDYAVGNMEGTLAGNEDGYEYKGYPNFNAPDAIAEAAKDSGFDMLLTANNHSYDTRSHGFHRTQQVISDLGLDYIGTCPDSEAANYILKEINGIKIAMTCYTYDTRHVTSGNISLNTIPLTAEDAPLINTFHYDHLDEFYGKLEQELAQMKADGADVTMLFIHWGDEYYVTPNSIQKKMAQEICNLGVDMIVGGHPHVIQPMEMLTSTKNPDDTTLCLYSLGNAVSNIVHGTSHPYECEDGIFFAVTFAKYSDGTVLAESVEVLPYHVNRYYDATLDRYLYPMIPLDTPEDQWQDAYALTDEMFDACQASLRRTQAILGDGLTDANAFLQQQQEQVEDALGIA